MDFNEINKVIAGMTYDTPFCDVMADILGRFFDCDYVFMFIKNNRGDGFVERVFQIGGASEISSDLFDRIGAEFAELDEPKILVFEADIDFDLGPNAKIMATPILYNSLLKGTIAILREEGTAWDAGHLDRLNIMVNLIATCYQYSVSLSNSQQYFNTILESINTAIFAIAKDGTMIHFNKAAEKIFACPADQAIGKHYFNTMSYKEREKMRSSFDYVMRTGNDYSGHFVEMTLLNDRVIYINPRICPWVNSEDEIIGAIGIMTDETENRYFQDQLVRAEKMAILGQIAAQVSHEVMSPLASIRGFARIIEKNEQEGSKYQSYAKTIVKQVDRVTMVVRELLDFSRPDEIKPQIVDINKAIESAIEQIQIDDTRVTIIKDYKQDIPYIYGDYQKIERAFVNLIQNGYQSLEESGIIEIKTCYLPDNYVVVSIKDSGCGIPRQHLKKVFDPYFTTKDNGTGLGLAIVQQTLLSHKGKIHVASDLGVGTCFTLKFPVGMDENNG